MSQQQWLQLHQSGTILECFWKLTQTNWMDLRGSTGVILTDVLWQLFMPGWLAGESTDIMCVHSTAGKPLCHMYDKMRKQIISITCIQNAYTMHVYRSTKHTWLDVVIAVGSETAGANPAEAERLAQGK